MNDTMVNNETTTPLISVIVPVYRAEPYLRRCLDSIVSQTYRNLEIILVDDGSPDRSGAICDEYAARDSRIIVIHQENKGVSEARNIALDMAKGDYFQFSDSDDWMEPRASELALRAALDQHADLVSFGYRVIYPSGKIRTEVAASSGQQDKAAVMKDLVWQKGHFRDGPWNKLFARRLFDGMRFSAGRVYEDTGLLYRLLQRADLVYSVSEVLYNYFLHPGSITSNGYQYHAHKDRLFSFEQRLHFLEQYYPDLVDLQLSMTLRELLIGKEKMKGDPHYGTYLKEVEAFEETYRDRIRDFAKYTRLTWVYCHCRPLLPLFIKLRH